MFGLDMFIDWCSIRAESLTLEVTRLVIECQKFKFVNHMCDFTCEAATQARVDIRVDPKFISTTNNLNTKK
jgi:hypothetical protein